MMCRKTLCIVCRALFSSLCEGPSFHDVSKFFYHILVSLCEGPPFHYVTKIHGTFLFIV